ncbi:MULTISPECIES: hypothetical protein [Sinorhizobium/Ensifer group]|nr:MULTISPECIES: hypothetical protein [Sinorhizobium/Ensifer group]WEJ08490.1 hypothetical protein N0Q90_02080 [Sinorhizobium sp. M103]WEJ14008.1 hypothetical protein N0Q91_00635 [Sinorhizobium sp. K101]WEJ35607.1 hypothetical protein N0R80_00630 [Sinorhizobium sp. C101]
MGELKLSLDLVALDGIAGALELGPQFFDVLFDGRCLISLSS